MLCAWCAVLVIRLGDLAACMASTVGSPCLRHKDEQEVSARPRLRGEQRTRQAAETGTAKRARALPPRFPEPPLKSIACKSHGLVGLGPLRRYFFIGGAMAKDIRLYRLWL